jgi:hypothetical protein
VTLEQALELLGARSKGKRSAKPVKPAVPAAKSTKKKGPPSRAKAAARKKGQAKQTPEAAE